MSAAWAFATLLAAFLFMRLVWRTSFRLTTKIVFIVRSKKDPILPVLFCLSDDRIGRTNLEQRLVVDVCPDHIPNDLSCTWLNLLAIKRNAVLAKNGIHIRGAALNCASNEFIIDWPTVLPNAPNMKSVKVIGYDLIRL